MTPAESLYVAALDPIPPHWGGLGAVRRIPSTLDYPAIWHPEVREVLEAGGADSVDWTNKVCSIENQGMDGSCVPFSTDAGIQINENINQNVCYRFDSAKLYHELGGSGPNGVDSRQTLERCKNVGAPLINSDVRVRVGSYFWIDQNPATFATQVKAALVAGKSVVVALLLPSSFSGRWTPGNPTQGYHQLPIAGTLGDFFWGPNSWSENWPGAVGPHPAGFYELSFQYVIQDAMQRNYAYAYFFDTLAIGPPPPPVKVLVNGYQPNPVKGGDPFSIQGGGFDQGGAAVTWQGQSLPILGMNPDVIATRAPQVTSPQSGPVHVTVGNGSADGPALTVTADAPPPPPVKTSAAVTGHATGADVSGLAPGQSYALGNGITLALQSVAFEDGPPPPGKLTVSGYTGYVAPLLPGQSFAVLGSGFAAAGTLAVTWGGQSVQATLASDTRIEAVAPAGANGANIVTVRIGTQSADGPLLLIGDGGPPPPPPGGIKVLLTTKPSQLRNKVSVIAYTTDANGNSLPASVNGQVVGSQGTTELFGQTTHGSQSPAIWTVQRPSPWGTECTVTVNAFTGGLTGTATAKG